MSLNWKEIDLILEELQLENCSIQKIKQPDFRTLLLELYAPGRRFSLLVSLAQGKTRLHAQSHPIKNRVSLQRFAQLLRSRIQGGRIVEAEQVRKERIVRLEVLRGGERSFLFLRLWGGAGNIILTDEEHRILDAFYRRPNRGEVSGLHFAPEELIQKANSDRGKPEREFSIRPFPADKSFNQSIEEEYLQRELDEEEKRLQEKLERLFQKQIKSIEEKIEELQREEEYGDEAERYRELGDILTSHIHAIDWGSRTVRLTDFYHDNGTIEIELDPKLSPQENAEKYYRRYRKLNTKKGYLQQELESLRSSHTAIEEERRRLAEEPSGSAKIEHLQELIDTYQPKKASSSQVTLPGLRFESHGFILLVGRNAKENDSLLRHYVRGNDYWMHGRDFPGAYVFIKHKSGKSVPLETLLDAGNLALHYSKAKHTGQGDLYYTQVKYLRRVKEGKQGLVIPTQEKNISIRLDPERLQRLTGSPRNQK